jgi:hypothetical protein
MASGLPIDMAIAGAMTVRPSAAFFMILGLLVGGAIGLMGAPGPGSPALLIDIAFKCATAAEASALRGRLVASAGADVATRRGRGQWIENAHALRREPPT